MLCSIQHYTLLLVWFSINGNNEYRYDEQVVTTGLNCFNPLYGERHIGLMGLPLPGVDVRIVNSEAGGDSNGWGNRGRAIAWTECLQRYCVNLTKPPLLSQPMVDSRLVIWDSAKRMVTSPYAAAPMISLSAADSISIRPKVERVLAEHPAVNVCAVIGCPDKEWAEMVTAVVVLN